MLKNFSIAAGDGCTSSAFFLATANTSLSLSRIQWPHFGKQPDTVTREWWMRRNGKIPRASTGAWTGHSRCSESHNGVKKIHIIDHFHKWRLFYYSFVCIQICLASLVLVKTFFSQKILYIRHGPLISNGYIFFDLHWRLRSLLHAHHGSTAPYGNWQQLWASRNIKTQEGHNLLS